MSGKTATARSLYAKAIRKVVRASASRLFAASPAIAKLALHIDRRFMWACKPPFSVVMDDYLGKYKLNIDARYGIEVGAFCGAYERHTCEVIRHLAPKGGTAIDVGANAGCIAIAMADTLEGGTVHCFEPSPAVFPRLRANIALNPSIAPSFVLNNVGLGDKPGLTEFFEFGHALGNGGCNPPEDGSWTPSIREVISITTLDNYVSENSLKSVDFIKIDTENYEYNILVGAQHTIKRYRPILYVETLLKQMEAISGRDNFIRINSLISSFGYAAFAQVSDRVYVPVTEDNFQQDTIFVPDERREMVQPRHAS